MLPTFKTRFDMKNRDFIERIGVRTKETFAPADIELEPHFDLVAEWRDYRVTSRLRLQDLLMDKLFAWMDQYGFRFHEDIPIRLIGIFGRLSSRLSDRTRALIADVFPEVPPNMRRSTIQAVAMLHKTAEPLLADLRALEQQSLTAMAGRCMRARCSSTWNASAKQRLGGLATLPQEFKAPCQSLSARSGLSSAHCRGRLPALPVRPLLRRPLARSRPDSGGR